MKSTTSSYKKEKIVSLIIILAITAITVYSLSRIPELTFTGSVGDLIVIEEDKPVLSGEAAAEDCDELVVIVSGEDLYSVKGFKEIDRITKGFEEFQIPEKPKAKKENDGKSEEKETPKFLAGVLSITNSSVPKSNPITDRNLDKKTRMGCKYAFQQAEKSYEKYKDTALSQIRFDLHQKPVFPKFPEPDFKESVNYLSFQTFWQELPQDEHELRHFLTDINQSLFIKNFVSPGKKDIAILLSVSRKTKYSSDFVITTLKKAAKDLETSKTKIIIAGDLVLSEEVRVNIIEDTQFFIKLAAFLWCLSFGFCFRTIRGIILPFVSLAVSEIWLLGLMAVFGLNLNIVLYIVPIFLVAVGSSASIHVMSKFYSNIDEGRHHVEAAVESFKDLIVPVGTASATTALGFAMLMLSNVKGLNHFTLLCIAGLTFNTINSLILLPCINVWLPTPRYKVNKSESRDKKWMGFIRWIMKFRKWLIAIFMVLSLFSILGIIVIVPDNDLTKLISKDSQSLKDLSYLSQKLAGTTVMTLVLEATPGRFMDKDMLSKINELQVVLEKSPNIDKTTSVVDLIKLTRHLSDGGVPSDRPLFKEQHLINSNIHFMENLKEDEAFKSSASALEKLMRAFSSKDYSTALIMIRSNVTSLRLLNLESQMIKAKAAQILGNKVKISLKGEILSINKAIEKVLTGQTQGVIFALLTIFVLMLILFFSFKIAVLCVIPNVFPILFFYGYLGFTGIGLDLSSGLIACVAIGIAVDDTIHFMVEMRKYMQRTYDVGDAMLSSIKSVGMPIINTSLVLAVMFGMLYFSKFQVFSSLGLLQAQTMLLCLVCNLVLLPAILSSFRIVSIWNILTRFHDFDPSKVILLEGMSPLSCRIVLGLGKLVDKKQGEIIVKQDELGDEMYIVINGRARVYQEKGDKLITLKLMDSGDLFGEMAVFGSPVRSATVKAETDIKLLAISKEFFEHAETLYPRTCSRFLKNVISIVSQRLRTVNYAVVDKVTS